ncbi:IgGFc-binding protein-like [Portunus trituberculatus]|uniref:IgGFc-binding protein-like n=1 Tax=Portunus trituberculatus TaxID=210409 RepID=UPI001E1D0454|nr:IgGFc-binding protein-like [Portunus trituberculatus]
MEKKAPWVYSSAACLLLAIGAAVVTPAVGQRHRENCCYGKSSFEHGQTVASLPSCCLYLTCHDGDIRERYIGKTGDKGCCEFDGLIYPEGAELTSHCAMLICRRGVWVVSNEIAECCKHCYLFNDPHIHTHDGHYYDWHGICNYTVTQPGNGLYPDYGVFSDFRRCYNSASCLDVSTFKNDRYTVITLRHSNPFIILVNNDEFVVPTTGVSEVHSSHGKHPVLVWRDGDCIFLTGSSKIMVQHCRHRLDVWAHPSHVNVLYGLCGCFNFLKEDDFTSRDLTQHPLHPWPVAFAESWRTPDQERDCQTCHGCDRETTGDQCTLNAAQREELRAICSRRLHVILATDEELDHYVDACLFDLCQLRQTGATKEEQDNWLRELETIVQNAKIILAKTSGEWKPLPEVPPSQDLCVPGSRWMMDCNWCDCSDNGQLARCTRRGCLEGYIHPLGEEACIDGSRWKMDCNWCNCVRGGFICTRNSCGPATFPPPAGTIPALSTFPTSLQVCLQPKDPGNCYGFFPRYYFNSTMKRCEYFIYGGCGGNQNNFESLRDCENACNSTK